MITENLTVVANGDPDSRIDLDTNIGVNEELHKMKVFSALVGVTFMVACGSAEASFVDDETELGQAIPELRSAIGNHPRLLKIEVDPNVVTIEAQDPHSLNHVNRWRCVNRVLGFIPMQWVIGPEAVDLQLLDPDLEANLFDLDAVVFSAM